MTAEPRKIALYVLNRLDNGRNTLDQILDDALQACPHLSRRDRALMHALVFGVLRWRGLLDWVIARFSSTRLERIDPGVLNVLRLGLFQILILNRIPVSAAVNSSVELAKSVAPIWVVRFVNALLRKAAAEQSNLPLPDPAQDPMRGLTVQKSFPQWLVKRWLKRFGEENTTELCDSINAIPPITVRTNRLVADRENLILRLKEKVEKIERTRYAPDGVSFFAPDSSLPEMAAFQDGWFQVQDEAAQMVALLLDPKPGEKILDACAGLGGKTGHIAQLMKNRGYLVAVDHREEKLSRLRFEMGRLRISSVETGCHDLMSPATPGRLGMFNRVLLDAPCSGLGVIRRNPDVKWSMSEERLKQYHRVQTGLLDNLAQVVNPFGILVYAVCTFEPEENDEVVSRFLGKHPEFAIDGASANLRDAAGELFDPRGFLRTYPHLHCMDGFFAARFKRVR